MKSTLIAVLVFCFLSALSFRSFSQAVDINDSLALVDLYDSTDGANWNSNTNWLTGNVSTWTGVTVENGRVTSLSLNDNNLSGSIPSSIENLTELRYLDFAGNHLNGNIPSTLGNLENIIILYLQGNQLSGSIPSSLGNLTKCTYFSLGNNNLTDNIPSSLGNLLSVQSFYLGDNQLNGTIPPSLGYLPNCAFLYLGNNDLTGEIPYELGNFLNIKQIDLSGNLLTGTIPPQLGNLKTLLTLNLSSNQLKGNIPSSFSNLENLSSLSLSYNQLNGSIPTSLGNLKNLYFINLRNNQLSGSIPESFGNLTGLVHLILKNNQLSGTIPSTLGRLSKLSTLNLMSNHLGGSIPSSLGNDTSLTIIDFQLNKLTGQIPATFGNLKNLGKFNTYSGATGYLDLSYNQLSHTIPSSLGNLSNLDYINMSNNLLTGEIPSTLSNLSNLDFLSIANNKFTFNGMETLVESLGNIDSLIYFPQDTLPIYNQNNIVSVSAGGTPSNDTFRLFKDGVLETMQIGDSTFEITSTGKYNITVTNAIATKLTLFSDTINITTLPISLSSFSAIKKPSSVLLNWQTASEQNNAYFAIERSNNGNTNFKEIARVNSKGNSNQLQQYSFEDFSPLSGSNYYRLKQVDKDGKSTYSKAVFVDFDKPILIKLYPNPVKDILVLEGLNANTKTTISIIDLQGNVLGKTSATNSTYKWNIKQLPAGNYYVRIEADKKVETMKFMKE